MSKEYNSKAMDINFELLQARVLDAIEHTNLAELHKALESIEGPTICVGSGGSKVTSAFVAKILENKNSCAVRECLPNELRFLNKAAYQNVFMSSYSAENLGVKTAFDNNLKHYLLTAKEAPEGTVGLEYKTNMEREDSFIAIAGTLIPMAIMLTYYCGKENAIEAIKQTFKKTEQEIANVKLCNENAYDIMTDGMFSSAATFLESTMVEGALGTPTISEKYDYVHGRSTTAHVDKDRALIYLLGQKTELDDMMLTLAKKTLYKDKMTVVKVENEDPILADFEMTVKSMYLCQKLAHQKQIDLSMMSGADGERMNFKPSPVKYAQSLTELEPEGKKWNEEFVSFNGKTNEGNVTKFLEQLPKK